MSLAEAQTPSAPYLVAIGVNDLPRAWPKIEPLLQKACAESRGEYTVEAVLANMGLNDGVERWKLLAIIDGADVIAVMTVAITQLWNGERVLDCILAGGESAKDWPQVDPEFDAFAREHGCRSVRIPCARKGWAKALPHWRIKGYVMVRDI